MTPVTDFETAQDNLAASLPNYERREKQSRLAHKIESQIRGEGTSRHALLQASTGTGKSLAYLIPAILSGKKVVVSTATKALQDQIVGKDLPFLQEHLGVDFTYAMLKGRSNYVCRASVEGLEGDDAPLKTTVEKVFEAKKDATDFLAERDDFDIEDRVWPKLTVSSSECPGRSECPFGDECFVEKARANAMNAQVVVVNHSLLLTDAWLDEVSNGNGTLLPDYEVLIVDEAHELAEYASSVWGVTLKENQLLKLGTDVGVHIGRFDAELARELSMVVHEYTDGVTNLWKSLSEGRLRQNEVIELADHIITVSAELQEILDIVKSAKPRKNNNSAEQNKKLAAAHLKIVRRIENMIDTVQSLITDDFSEVVRWVSIEPTLVRGRKGVDIKVINSVPIEVGKILERELWATDRLCRKCDGKVSDSTCGRCNDRRTKTNITSLLLSATLSIGGQFDYVSNQLGLSSYDSFDVGTPFDFPNRARLYVPAHLPEPNSDSRSWEGMSISEIDKLVRASDGRALLLFTSNKQMRSAYEVLSSRLPYTCFIQGSESNKVLAGKFMEDTHSVLFATKSFFTGVDFQGSACSLVVMDKLPFAVPTDPVFQARCEAIEARGGNTFNDYTIPMMTLILQQGFGRLIRHTEDTGVVAILDRRLTTKGYGKRIVRALPDAPLITTMDEVSDFFESVS
jgi:ATP-dependent DNA helicase DinG